MCRAMCLGCLYAAVHLVEFFPMNALLFRKFRPVLRACMHAWKHGQHSLPAICQCSFAGAGWQDSDGARIGSASARAVATACKGCHILRGTCAGISQLELFTAAVQECARSSSSYSSSYIAVGLCFLMRFQCCWVSCVLDASPGRHRKVCTIKTAVAAFVGCKRYC